MPLQVVNRLAITGLATVLSSAIIPPASAQVLPPSVTCQVTIPIEQGASLTYRLTGAFPDRVPPNTPQNPVGRTVTMTVQRRDRSGKIQTWLNQANVEDYEQGAPDADYSKLPFTGDFRGKPNDGFRLYRVNAAVNGLYVSLRPTKGQPQKIQIIHYLNAKKFVRSEAGQCQSDAAVIKTLAPLQQALKAKDWALADRETRRLLDPSSVSLKPLPEIKLTPELIRAIDRAWMDASNGRFGLTVQAKLWESIKAKSPKDEMVAINQFRDRVGWKLMQPRKENDFLSSDWLNESELNYSEKAPVGHLPWMGVSDAVVYGLAAPSDGSHCGSCHTDAMQLRNERFYGYLPRLMTRVQAAL
ncbi:GUN4 domain-containing protein [Alkalinema sp. FACHB-956]|uniref:GUN4 domain-containing protein n=1 Tax=Alkalinema sp. FACHB-956 TaxID=2692768 RepID=UPI001686E7CC|nr:GUN4 domain-containing protein [Alkalinema sp. FACHB-956]MBD2330030.1 GUN4 domain-containing protein [Alkalinema sp. FACHB-956]